MKKFLLCLSFFSLLNYNYAQEYEMKNDFGEEVFAAHTKKIDYQLRVYQQDKIIYSGEMILNNSVITPILFLQDNTLKNRQGESLKGKDLNDNQMNKEEEKINIDKQMQLRLAVHVGKDNQDLWSQFFIEDSQGKLNTKINAEKNTVEQTQLTLSAQPQLQKVNKELIVAHKKNKESILVWENYKFVFTGK